MYGLYKEGIQLGGWVGGSLRGVGDEWDQDMLFEA